MDKKNSNVNSTTSEKNSIEALQKEIKSLKTKLDNYEKENKGLMKSIYDLTTRYDLLVHQIGRSAQIRPFNIDSLLTPQTPEITSGSLIQSVAPSTSSASSSTQINISNISGTAVNTNSSSVSSNTSTTTTPTTTTLSTRSTSSDSTSATPTTSNISQPSNLGKDLDHTVALSSNNSDSSHSHHHHHHHSQKGKKMDERHFFYKFTLKGHGASVYTCKFSPCGKMIASGSFDKTVKIWDVYNQTNLATFSDHNVNVSELAWNNSSTEILSASYDKSVKLWDLASNKLISSHNTSGFVLDVMFSPGDDNIFFAGNTQNHLIGFDKRSPNSIIVMENDSLINALHIYKDGKHILTGDQLGKLKLWDSRKASKTSLPESFHYEGGVDGFMGTYPSSSSAIIESFEITTENRPISSLTFSRNTSGNPEEDGRFLAVNCFDNVLRVYDRSKVSIVQSHPYALSPMYLAQSLTGHKNKNWPIKSSIFIGKEFDNNNQGGNPSTLNSKETSKPNLEEDEEEETQEDNINQSVLLATGSADYNAYIFDIGYSKQSSGRLIQKLEGHTDKVFSTRFHPTEPILATCSADSTIRLWTPKKKLFNS